MKKFICVAMVIVCMFTIAVPAFAEEALLSETEVIMEENNVPEIQETLQTDINENEPVVKLYLCATISSLTGHIWLYFVNLTDRELPLGYVTLKPHEEMSVGSLRNTRADGGGTYYNGEAYMAGNLKNVCDNTVSLNTDLTYEELLIINEKIKNHNFYLILGDNCGDFACRCWNAVAPVGKKVINILVPIFTILQFVVNGGKTGDIEMKRPDISRVFKQENNGARNAEEKSFNASCVNW